MRPVWLALDSVNQRFPSGLAVIEDEPTLRSMKMGHAVTRSPNVYSNNRSITAQRIAIKIPSITRTRIIITISYIAYSIRMTMSGKSRG
jgi:hypothetical protein